MAVIDPIYTLFRASQVQSGTDIAVTGPDRTLAEPVRTLTEAQKHKDIKYNQHLILRASVPW